MLQVARLAPNLLQESAERVADFVRGQFNADGGTRDRAGKSDLYYTVFGLESLIALRQEPPFAAARPWLESFGDGEGLDYVHLTCLARCWAALPKGSLDPGRARRIADRVRAQPPASVYNAFLALGAHQDLGAPDPEGLADLVVALPDGSYPQKAGVPAGSTPTTAAAVTVLRHLRREVPRAAADWLLQRARPEGGFEAAKGAPMPDLLSTATALHALAGMQVSFAHLRESCLDYIDTLWTGRSFCGNWADDVPDCEYAYYALLSLGHLSL